MSGSVSEWVSDLENSYCLSELCELVAFEVMWEIWLAIWTSLYKVGNQGDGNQTPTYFSFPDGYGLPSHPPALSREHRLPRKRDVKPALLRAWKEYIGKQFLIGSWSLSAPEPTHSTILNFFNMPQFFLSPWNEYIKRRVSTFSESHELCQIFLKLCLNHCSSCSRKPDTWEAEITSQIISNLWQKYSNAGRILFGERKIPEKKRNASTTALHAQSWPSNEVKEFWTQPRVATGDSGERKKVLKNTLCHQNLKAVGHSFHITSHGLQAETDRVEIWKCQLVSDGPTYQFAKSWNRNITLLPIVYFEEKHQSDVKWI